MNRNPTPSLLGATIEFDTIYCEKPLSTIQLPQKYAPLGCLRNGEVLSTSADPTINIGDHQKRDRASDF